MRVCLFHCLKGPHHPRLAPGSRTPAHTRLARRLVFGTSKSRNLDGVLHSHRGSNESPLWINVDGRCQLTSMVCDASRSGVCAVGGRVGIGRLALNPTRLRVSIMPPTRPRLSRVRADTIDALNLVRFRAARHHLCERWFHSSARGCVCSLHCAVCWNPQPRCV